MFPVREGGAGGGWDCDPDLRREVKRVNEASLSVSYLDPVGQVPGTVLASTGVNDE